ncbi:helix-turn-helix domain-containing protein [Aquamicrobium soli]|uniref:Helix-turn-helix domain-containing protein n=1 Tax=Aquamicrobium soli TaxID=1811518 RepID=A0ABV7KBI3_9HYPH
MTNAEFRAIRLRLGFTQAGLAAFLGYSHSMRVSEFERALNPRPVPEHLARLMRAYDEGYRPADWPLSAA